MICSEEGSSGVVRAKSIHLEHHICGKFFVGVLIGLCLHKVDFVANFGSIRGTLAILIEFSKNNWYTIGIALLLVLQ